MEQRLLDFITGLRASGVRISLVESADAWQAVQLLGVHNKNQFKQLLAATLVKDQADIPIFDHLFPIYFGGQRAPTLDLTQDLSPESQALLRQALEKLRHQLRDLLQRLLQGDRFHPEELQGASARTGLARVSHPYQKQWFTRRMLNELGLKDLIAEIEALLFELAERGMDPLEAQLLAQGLSDNLEAWRQQVEDYVGGEIARNQAQEQAMLPSLDDLMARPFRSLSESETAALRDQIRRLAAHLRAKAAMRRKRGDKGTLDAKGTLRTNLRFGGVPMQMRWKKRHLKPKLCLICDVSTSMRPVVAFMLHLIYELQDQVARSRSFAFISDMHEISHVFATHRPDVAVAEVLSQLQPGYYNTSLGASLHTFQQEYLGAIDRRTTVIFVGDARNNYNNPRADLVELIGHRCRQLLWLTPEPEPMWGTGDSDMWAYLPLLDRVETVQNLKDLVRAVDKILAQP